LENTPANPKKLAIETIEAMSAPARAASSPPMVDRTGAKLPAPVVAEQSTAEREQELHKAASLFRLMMLDTIILRDEALSPQRRRLFRAAHDCRWGVNNLFARRHRNFPERRRTLVLRAVNIATRFIQSGDPHRAIEELDCVIQFLPNAVLLHAVRVCALFMAGHKNTREFLLRHCGRQICDVRWENIIFFQLDRLRKLPRMTYIIYDVETLVDRMRPSHAELRRIEMRLRELAGADFDTSAANHRAQPDRDGT
jgi:hypothetical protein